MKVNPSKYVPFEPIDLPDRRWPSARLEKAPIWCSVDLRDGNQALVDPMNLEEKLEYFKMLCEMGFREIEVGFPSANETEYEICRELIEGGHIPDGVAIQVLVQAREHLIRRTFEAIRGAKHVIVHFYNSTSTLQRKVVFGKDMQGIIDIAVRGAQLIRRLAEECGESMDIRFEYSPESFSGTEPDNAVAICDAVVETMGATPERPMIINLPNTVEMCTPNTYADQVEYFIRHTRHREAMIVSVHPHNDRGTGVAATELALLAGAERVEGTLFGNGERTGNLDIVTLGLNLYTQGIDPGLDFSHLPRLREMYERCTKMPVGDRHPYAGDLVFTAFSGSHQDAINKGLQYMKQNGSTQWQVPYLPIDPADVGREYESIIRINSQSGKGGAAYIMQNKFGYTMPKAMHPEFGRIVTAACDKKGKEFSPDEVFDLFRREYIEVSSPYSLVSQKFYDEGEHAVRVEAVIRKGETETAVSGTGNGPIDAFFNALQGIGVEGYHFVSYHEHAISAGSDSKAIAYIELKDPQGRTVFGVGISHNIYLASVRGVLCAINRSLKTE